ncbi:hypothetical protein [Methylobacterium sp. J-090]|uniref:hypothetical protein n=1 Tax=Methylobacterium sp. J-090 TaxID=2836666 RepID=UPI001FB98B62|nr:hypothetical protein [Methylobacterium sp. J-090]MCJ2084182.1 hypothetical protein [Methylobacterium sp. J-090]
MRKKQIRSKRAPSIRRTSSEQDWILEQFTEAQRQGIGGAEAAQKLRVSVGTIYRWQRQRGITTRQVRPTIAQDISIETAIARLVDESNTDRLKFLEALFKFIAWLRWPNTPNDHPAAITACVIVYLSHARSTETLEQLEAEELSLVLRHVRIDVLRRICTGQMLAVHIFDILPILNQPYDELDFLANIAWFLLSFKPKTADHRDRVSLNKSYHASQSGVFEYKWPMSHITFKKYWSRHGSASPFLYVERFHSGPEFLLNPMHSDFVDSVKDIIEDRIKLRRYLAQCRTAVEMLQSRLDYRALKTLRFPCFPDDLKAEPIQLPELPEITVSVIRSYGRGDKR